MHFQSFRVNKSPTNFHFNDKRHEDSSVNPTEDISLSFGKIPVFLVVSPS